jgi:leucyl aminopeptidase
MELSIWTRGLDVLEVDVLAVGVAQHQPFAQQPWLQELDQFFEGRLLSLLTDEGFEAKVGDATTVTTLGRIGPKRLVLVGTGPLPPCELSARMVAVAAGRHAEKSGGRIAAVAPGGDAQLVQAAAEGLYSGAYRYEQYLQKRKPAFVSGVVVLRENATAAGARLQQARVVGEALHLVRDLVNEPPNEQTPAALAERCRLVSEAHALRCSVFGPEQRAALNMPLLQAVGGASSNPPYFVHMTYRPDDLPQGAPRVVLVGKGVTFDSGGLSIKPQEHLPMMKLDMAGAALTLMLMQCAARLHLPLELHGLISAAENAIGSNAYRPGDVFRARDGRSVEIVNTDCEGRLMLADALCYATELKPDYIIDHATLTGACVIALGFTIGGYFSNDRALAGLLAQTAQRTGESYWELPLSPELEPTLMSQVAELRHAAPIPMGSAITAALFLSKFVGSTPWLHLDIAGPSYLQLPKPHPLYPNGGTGFGLITALAVLRELASRGSPKDAQETASAPARGDQHG